MSSRPFVKASGNNILDISGQLNIKVTPGFTDNSGIRFYGSKRRDIRAVMQDYSNNYIGITADASGEDIMYHLPYDDKGNTLNDISDCHIIATQCYVNENATKAVNNRGQTFFEIMTEQPQKFTSEPPSNSGNVIINWNYNDIIPNSDFPCNLLLAAKKSTIKDKQLPYIDKIYIDISGSVVDPQSGQSGIASDSSSNKWLRHDIMIIGDDGYNQDADKTFTFNKTALSSIYENSIKNILGKDTSANSFDVRIYGENFADKENSNCPFPDASDNSTFNNEYSRALIIPGLFFPGANPPTQPKLVKLSESVTFDSITASFNVESTQSGVSNSNARIIKSKAEYVGIETLSSVLYPISDISLNQTQQDNVGILNPFDVTLSDIKSGSKYKYKVAAMNDLINEYSAFSDIYTSSFTNLPDNDTTNINFTYSTTERVTNKTTLVDTSCVYINVGGGNQHIVPISANDQIFEITKEIADNKPTPPYEGFGKFIDGSKNLVTITMKINDVSINEIQYHGFGSTGATDLSFNKYSIAADLSNNAYMTYSQNDIGNNDYTKGFRINGKIKLQTIPNPYVQSYIGNPSKNAIILRYEYLRDYKVGGSNTSVDNYIYIDNLSSTPTTTSNIINVSVTNEAYLMGIPSVRTFSIQFTRIYININSEYEYIPGDRIIAKIFPIQNTSFKGDDVKIESESIQTSGIYPWEKTFNNVSYENSTISSSLINQEFAIQTDIYSLKTTTNISNNINVNHYCDRNSFEVNTNGVFTPHINNTSTNPKKIYEIADISELSNIKKITLNAYSNSNMQSIKKHTLLYFNGAFRSNTNLGYPNNAPDVNPLNTGNYAYNLSGVSDPSGYKWIGFKIAFISSSDKTTSWTAGKTTNFAGLSSTYIKLDGSVFYFDFQDFLSLYGFQSTSINILTNDSSKNIIGFIKQINAPSDSSFSTCIGNISFNINPTSTWMHNNVADNTSLDSILNGELKPKHGCLKTLSSNDYKVIQLSEDLAARGSGIDLFIGFKNSVKISSNNT